MSSQTACASFSTLFKASSSVCRCQAWPPRWPGQLAVRGNRPHFLYKRQPLTVYIPHHHADVRSTATPCLSFLFYWSWSPFLSVASMLAVLSVNSLFLFCFVLLSLLLLLLLFLFCLLIDKDSHSNSYCNYCFFVCTVNIGSLIHRLNLIHARFQREAFWSCSVSYLLSFLFSESVYFCWLDLIFFLIFFIFVFFIFFKKKFF